MNETLQYQLRLHGIVLIFGFTGILGKLISLPAYSIVFYRTIIACLGIGIYLAHKGISLKISGKNLRNWLLTGLLVGFHWFFFFESIKVSTVSIALVSFSSTALFTALIEPAFRKKKISVYELVFSVFIIIGMLLVLRFEFRYAKGIVFGLIGAFLASLFTVLNSKFVEDHRPSVISFYELLGAVGVITVLSLWIDPAFIANAIPTYSDVLYLVLLGLVATAFAFVVAVQIMKKLTPFTISLTINLEPLYGILLSVVIFGEEELMSGGFYAGFSIILCTVLANAYFKKRGRKKMLRSEGQLL